MRFLLARTDALGDLVVSLPVMDRILSRDPGAEVHWLVRPYAAPVLEHVPGIAQVHLREEHQDLAGLIRGLAPDVVLNLGHRDAAVTVAAREAGVPMRVARARRMPQILAATHRLWAGRTGTGRHESQHALDFLAPLGWSGGVPAPPRLVLTPTERALGLSDLSAVARPRVGLVLKGSGSGACPSPAWWQRAQGALREAGWHPVVLAPAEASEHPAGGLRHLMAQLAACDVVVSPSTGPAHLAAALDVPVVALMGHRPSHGPDRWAPLGRQVQVLTYPGPEADLQGGLDRLDPLDLVAHLARYRA